MRVAQLLTGRRGTRKMKGFQLGQSECSTGDVLPNRSVASLPGFQMSFRPLRVLVACEVSGNVRDAFRERGHKAWSCDLEAGNSFYHLPCDVRLLLRLPWDLMVAFPPCTFLCNSSVRWLHEREGRFEKMRTGAAFFRDLLNADIPMIAVENPIPHKYAVEEIGIKYQQKIQPYDHGHGESKATCLWLKNLPPLMVTKQVRGREQRIWKMAPGKDRSRKRSVTFLGVARAMAEQWGKEIP